LFDPRLQTTLVFVWKKTMLRILGIFAFIAAAGFAQSAGAQAEPRDAASLSDLALEWQQHGHPTEAVELYTRALAMREKQFGAHSAEAAATLNNLGVALRLDARPADAEAAFRRALSIAEECFDQRLLATVLGGLGATLVDQGEGDRAEPVLRRSLAMFEHAVGADSIEASEAGNNLAMLYRRTGNLARAQEQMEHSLPLLQQRLGSDHPELAKALNGMFVILVEQNEWDRAEPYLRRALQIGQQVFPDSIQMAEFRENLALLAAHHGEFQAAASLEGDAIASKQQLLGAKNPQLAESFEAYSGYLKKINQKSEARRAEAQAREIRKSFQ
jgi:tetratricopeptide (TPR) repeat protein